MLNGGLGLPISLSAHADALRTIQTLEDTPNRTTVEYEAATRIPIYMQQHTVFRNSLKKKVEQFSSWEDMMKMDNKNAVKIKMNC
jgi:hypothetical protein